MEYIIINGFSLWTIPYATHVTDIKRYAIHVRIEIPETFCSFQILYIWGKVIINPNIPTM